jgi:hypothetical protein
MGDVCDVCVGEGMSGAVLGGSTIADGSLGW